MCADRQEIIFSIFTVFGSTVHEKEKFFDVQSRTSQLNPFSAKPIFNRGKKKKLGNFIATLVFMLGR